MKKKLVRDKISNTPFLEQSILQTPLFLWEKSEPPFWENWENLKPPL